MQYSAQTNTETQCYHCGTPCKEEELQWESKAFCCSGCLSVHQILLSNDMESYYELESFPGQKRELNRDYRFADNAELAEQFIDFKNDSITRITIKIPAIHCSSCIWLLENIFKIESNIFSSRVNFENQKAIISFYHNEISLREVLELLDKIGYAPEIGQEKEKKSSKDKDLLKRMAFAGFVFGNIMLFSFPEYFGFVTDTGHKFGRVFSALNAILAVPLVLYSGKVYLKTAYESLKVKSLHIYVPVSIGILALFFWSMYEVTSGIGPGYFDSLSGLIFFLLIGKWFQEFTNRKLIFDRKYDAYFPLTVQMIKGDTEQSVPLNDLDKGDRIRIRKGELIPADGHLFRGTGQIDYSFVTGESVPEHKELGEKVYAGGRQMAETIEIELLKKVKESRLVSLWTESNFDTDKSYGTQSLIGKTSKVFTIALLIVAVLTFLLWLPNLEKAIFSSISVLIVACPCALALAFPFASGTAKRILAKNQFYIKNNEVIERLSKTKEIVFDKTGTLTENLNYSPTYVGKPLSVSEKLLVANLAKQSDHPYSKAIAQHWSKDKNISFDSVKEIPGKGIEGWADNKWVKIGSAAYIFEDKTAEKKHQVYLSIDGNFIGAFDFKSNYYPFLDSIFSTLNKLKYKLHLYTGDSKREEKHLKSTYGKYFTRLVFNCTPKQKMEEVENLNNASETLYLGDGLNDAGALQSANVGVAVTKSLIHFTPASDAIITNEELKHLPNLLTYSKKVMQTVKIGIGVSALYNVIGLFFAIQGLLSPIVAAILMPVSSITTVALMVALTHYQSKKVQLS